MLNLNIISQCSQHLDDAVAVKNVINHLIA